MSEVYLRLSQVEEMTGINRDTLWRMCRSGLLPYRRRPYLYEVRLSDVAKLESVAQALRNNASSNGEEPGVGEQQETRP